MNHRNFVIWVAVFLIAFGITGQAIASMQILYICGDPPNYPDTTRGGPIKPLVITNSDDSTLTFCPFDDSLCYFEGDSFSWHPMNCFLFDMIMLYYWGQEKGLSDNQMHFLLGCGPPDWEPEWIDDYYNPPGTITDMAATIENLELMVGWLRDGNPEQGIEALAPNDT